MTKEIIEREPDLVFKDQRIIKLDKELLWLSLKSYCQAHEKGSPIHYLCTKMVIDEAVAIRPAGSFLQEQADELWQIVQRRNQLPWLMKLLDDPPEGNRIRCFDVILSPQPPYASDPTSPAELGKFVHCQGLYEDFNLLVERYPINPKDLSPAEILKLIADQPPFSASLIYFALNCFGWDWENLGNLAGSPNNISMLEKAWEKELWEPVGRAVSLAYTLKNYRVGGLGNPLIKIPPVNRNLQATLNDISRALKKI